MHHLFEYQPIAYDRLSFLSTTEERKEFKKVLQSIWDGRNTWGLKSFYSDEKSRDQQFFKFEDDRIKAGKYIGAVRYRGRTIQILPKVHKGATDFHDKHQLIKESNANVIWWLSRCSKISFPRSFSGWDTQSFDFLDVLVHLFANLTRDDLVYNKHLSYVEQEESIQTVRGRIDFAQYASNYYTGNGHILPCVYDSLEIDNLYNQIIKFTSRLLLNNTENEELKKILQEIVWILDEVSDGYFKAGDCKRVVVSPLNSNMQIILNYCEMFLSGTVFKSESDEFEVFAVLIPTEKLFEDFLFGLIKSEFENTDNVLDVNSQSNGKGPVYLAEEMEGEKKIRNVFKLKPDIYVSGVRRDLILDAKYKQIYTREEVKDKSRRKSGVASSDVYQMFAYHHKYDVNKVYLLYPERYGLNQQIKTHYELKGTGNDKLDLHYTRLSTLLDPASANYSLEDRIEHAEKKIKAELEAILN